MAFSKQTEDTIRTLRTMGTKFNSIHEADLELENGVRLRRIRLYFSYQRLNGRKSEHLVAELDGFGNITEEGPYFGHGRRPDRIRQFDADGNTI